MRKKELKTVITFETTTQAIGMESACKKNQIAGRLIPVPKEITAGCGMAARHGVHGRRGTDPPQGRRPLQDLRG